MKYADAVAWGVIPPAGRPAAPGFRTIGWDPGAPVGYFAVAETVYTEGPHSVPGVANDVAILEVGDVRWEDSPCVEDLLMALYRKWTPNVLLFEEQFLDPNIFFGEAARKRRMTRETAGKLFSDLRRLVLLCGKLETIWSVHRGGTTLAQRGAIHVPHGTWKANLAPARTHTTEMARGASIEFAALVAPTFGTGRQTWVDTDHDRAAATSIAVLGTGLTAATVCETRGIPWPSRSPARATAAEKKAKAAAAKAAKAKAKAAPAQGQIWPGDVSA